MKIKWNAKEYEALFSYKQNGTHWHVLTHDDFYVFVAELDGGGTIELMRINPLQHAILKNMELLAKDKVDEHFKKEIDEALAKGKEEADAYLANSCNLPGHYK
jgi:hypothetical protein